MTYGAVSLTKPRSVSTSQTCSRLPSLISTSRLFQSFSAAATFSRWPLDIARVWVRTGVRARSHAPTRALLVSARLQSVRGAIVGGLGRCGLDYIPCRGLAVVGLYGARGHGHKRLQMVESELFGEARDRNSIWMPLAAIYFVVSKWWQLAETQSFPAIDACHALYHPIKSTVRLHPLLHSKQRTLDNLRERCVGPCRGLMNIVRH